MISSNPDEFIKFYGIFPKQIHYVIDINRTHIARKRRGKSPQGAFVAPSGLDHRPAIFVSQLDAIFAA